MQLIFLICALDESLVLSNSSDGVADRLADSLFGVEEENFDTQVLKLMVAGPGIEPGTRGFSILCSTD